MELAISEGWKNITEFYLIPKQSIVSVCKSTLSTTRQKMTPGWVVKQMFSAKTRSWVANQLNQSYFNEKPSAKFQKSAFSDDIVLQISLTYLLSVIKSDKSWTAFRDNVKR